MYAGEFKIAESDDWGGSIQIARAMANVGAFPFASPASRDAALFTDVTSGDKSVRISSSGARLGTVLAEVYDATPSAELTPTTPRLLNLSVLKNLGAGITAGFAIAGTTAKWVLIRAVGPTLRGQPFGVANAASDPKIELRTAAGTLIAQNDNWGDSSALNAAFSSVGAFQLSAASRDAALVALLEPGAYTVQANAVGETQALALVEIYELP
jgi:hypothetical protein